MKSIGELIKQYRETAGISQVVLAKKLGVEFGQFISHIEHGKAPFPKDKFKLLSKTLEIPPDILFQAWIAEKKQEFWDVFI